MTTMRKPEDFTPAEVQGRQAEYPGMTEGQARISLERQQVYGDAFENHAGIAATWVGELQGWGQHISEGKPIPPDVVARMMALLKLNRCRLDYHEDNYIDHAVYAMFAQAWQKRRVASGGPMPVANPHRTAKVEKDKDFPLGAKVWLRTIQTGSPTDIREWLLSPRDIHLREGDTIIFEVTKGYGIGYIPVGKKDDKSLADCKSDASVPGPPVFTKPTPGPIKEGDVVEATGPDGRKVNATVLGSVTPKRLAYWQSLSSRCYKRGKEMPCISCITFFVPSRNGEIACAACRDECRKRMGGT